MNAENPVARKLFTFLMQQKYTEAKDKLTSVVKKLADKTITLDDLSKQVRTAFSGDAFVALPVAYRNLGLYSVRQLYYLAENQSLSIRAPGQATREIEFKDGAEPKHHLAAYLDALQTQLSARGHTKLATQLSTQRESLFPALVTTASEEHALRI